VDAARELIGWARQHGGLLFLATVAAYPMQHYELYGPPADLQILPALAVAMFLVVPLWGAVVHDSRDPLAWVLAGLGCAVALGPALAWAYGAKPALKEDPTPLVVGATVGLVLIVAAAARGRVSLARWGLGPGDLRWWGPKVGLILLVMVVAIPLFAWLRPEYVAYYPRYKPARVDWVPLVQYQAAMWTFMFAWEFLFRGFLLNGLSRSIGVAAAIVAQAYPFFLLHHSKPESEMVLSWVGGILIGWFCWRARSMWPGALLHSVQYTTMEVSAFLLR
jgi:membrane protease YdiL (CAAX protease family)